MVLYCVLIMFLCHPRHDVGDSFITVDSPSKESFDVRFGTFPSRRQDLVVVKFVCHRQKVKIKCKRSAVKEITRILY
jgi:hypothetical protein